MHEIEAGNVEGCPLRDATRKKIEYMEVMGKKGIIDGIITYSF